MKTFLSSLAGLSLFLLGGLAAAQASDTVHLTNGGRVRGHVMEDDDKGVSVLLADKTTKKIPRAEVMRVDYGGKAPGAPAAPSAAAPPVPYPTPSAVGAGTPTAPTGPVPLPLSGPGGDPLSGPPPSPDDRGDSEGFDRLNGSPIVAFVDVAGGYANVSGGRDNYQIEGHGGQLMMSVALGFPLGRAIALGAGGAFTPAFSAAGFAPGGFFGAYFGAYPIPNAGLNTSVLFGFGGGGVSDIYGGIGPGLQLGLAYDFLERRGAHPTVAFRFLYMPQFDQRHDDTTYHHIGVALGTGVNFH
jgi:hypothetical protein